jgi:hypothetical protein
LRHREIAPPAPGTSLAEMEAGAASGDLDRLAAEARRDFG